MPTYSRIGVTCNSRIQGIEGAVFNVISFLKKQKIRVYGDHRIKKRIGSKGKVYSLESSQQLDLLIVLGGDGTMLRAIHENLKKTSQFFGINMGRMGFLAESYPEGFEKKLGCILGKKCTMDQRFLLDIAVVKNNKKVKEFTALNEAVIHQTELTRLANLKTEVDRKRLCNYYVDGIIVATPTGSTAYSLSAGGPIVHPRIPAFIITPVNPHSFSQKPLVIPNDKKITVYPEAKNRKLTLTIDGRAPFHLGKEEKVVIRKYRKPINFVRLYEENYYRTIRKKLGWGEREIK